MAAEPGARASHDELDVGFYQCRTKHASLFKVRKHVIAAHPHITVDRVLDDGSRLARHKQHPVCGTHTGRHVLCQPKNGSSKASVSDLSQYGTAIVLYFKAQKFFCVLFTLLTIVYLPVILLYLSAAELEGVVAGTGAIALTTAGNLGSSEAVCTSASAARLGVNGSFTLACPDQLEIGSIHLLVGSVQGSCTCPSAQRPTPNCPSRYPYLSEQRSLTLPGGTSLSTGEACCSDQANRWDEAEFTALDPAFRRKDCSSPAAMLIATHTCIGKTTCTVDLKNPTSWPAEDASACPQPGFYAHGMCTMSPYNVTSAGSLQGCDHAPSALGAAMCYRTVVTVQGWASWLRLLGAPAQMSKTSIAVVTAVCNLVAVVVVMVAVAILARRQRDAVLESAVSTAADYTVFLPTVPPHRTLAELDAKLRTFFERYLSSVPAVDVEVPAVKVADIQYSMDMDRVMVLLAARGDAMYQLERDEKFLLLNGLTYSAMLKQVESGGLRLRRRCMVCLPKQERAIIQAARSLLKGVRTVQRIDSELQRHTRDNRATRASSAYVTFEQEEGAVRALVEFPDSRMSAWCSSRSKRLDNFAVRTRRAPEPSDIVWENAGTPRAQRCLRQTATWAITLALIAAVAVVLFLSHKYRRELARTYPSVDCAVQPQFTSADVVQEYLSGNTTTATECYCRGLLTTSGNPLSLAAQQFTVPQEGGGTASKPLCLTWVSAYLGVQALTIASAAVVVAANLSVTVIIRVLVKCERRRSRTSAMLSRTQKLVALMLLNIGLSIVLVNAYFASPVKILREGRWHDLDVGWYVEVGVALVTTLLLFTVDAHLVLGGKLVLARVSRCWDRGCTCDRHVTRKVLQRDLNSLYSGPSMFMDTSYARVVTMVFSALIYCSLIPALLPIAALFFSVMYCVEKAAFLRAYRTPAVMGTEIARSLAGLYMWVLPLNLGVAIWGLSNEKIFPPADAVASAKQLAMQASADAPVDVTTLTNSIFAGLAQLDSQSLRFSSRATTPATLPLLVMLLLCILYLLLRHVLINSARRAMRLCCSCAKPMGGLGLPPYFNALPVQVLEDFSQGKLLVNKSLEDGYRRGWYASQALKSNVESAKQQLKRARERRQQLREQVVELVEYVKHTQQQAVEAKRQLAMLQQQAVAVMAQSRSQAEAAAAEQDAAQGSASAEGQHNGDEDSYVALARMQSNGGSSPSVPSRAALLRNSESSALLAEQLVAVTARSTALESELSIAETQLQNMQAELQGSQQAVRNAEWRVRQARTQLVTEQVRKADTVATNQRISGLHSYDIAANPDYGLSFGFEADIRDSALRSIVSRKGLLFLAALVAGRAMDSSNMSIRAMQDLGTAISPAAGAAIPQVQVQVRQPQLRAPPASRSAQHAVDVGSVPSQASNPLRSAASAAGTAPSPRASGGSPRRPRDSVSAQELEKIAAAFR